MPASSSSMFTPSRSPLGSTLRCGMLTYEITTGLSQHTSLPRLPTKNVENEKPNICASVGSWAALLSYDTPLDIRKQRMRAAREPRPKRTVLDWRELKRLQEEAEAQVDRLEAQQHEARANANRAFRERAAQLASADAAAQRRQAERLDQEAARATTKLQVDRSREPWYARQQGDDAWRSGGGAGGRVGDGGGDGHAGSAGGVGSDHAGEVDGAGRTSAAAGDDVRNREGRVGVGQGQGSANGADRGRGKRGVHGADKGLGGTAGDQEWYLPGGNGCDSMLSTGETIGMRNNGSNGHRHGGGASGQSTFDGESAIGSTGTANHGMDRHGSMRGSSFARRSSSSELSKLESARQETTIDWGALASALPSGDDPESEERRRKLFTQWDKNGNGILSLNEVDSSMRELMDGVMGGFLRSSQHGWSHSWKPVLMRAFMHAKDSNKGAKKRGQRNDDYVELDEMRLLMCYMVRYFELYVAFSRIDTGHDRRFDLDEFVAALPSLRSWGIHVPETDAESEFRTIKSSSGCSGGSYVLFDEFICWAMGKNLVLDDFGGFDMAKRVRNELASRFANAL